MLYAATLDRPRSEQTLFLMERPGLTVEDLISHVAFPLHRCLHVPNDWCVATLSDRDTRTGTAVYHA
ncbi:hypothetical protein RSSM_04144 [Rhodopirellula sallentina SM41]|uniref:Uncharacterized protein n=1 Tax=Rhodopirellula sallentina SM41 TaxID=1263870 RepID=M5UEJ7_9BACT|nr:hypothetical protein RSSM_04144 [Rhodopirellula sallentina SM41]